MIVPHGSDYMISAMVYTGPNNSYHRIILVRREHPGRKDSYVLIQARSDDGIEESVLRTVTDRDITDDLFKMTQLSSISIAGNYMFFRFDADVTLNELIEMMKTDSKLRKDIELIFGSRAENIARLVEWKP